MQVVAESRGERAVHVRDAAAHRHHALGVGEQPATHEAHARVDHDEADGTAQREGPPHDREGGGEIDHGLLATRANCSASRSLTAMDAGRHPM